MGQQEDKMVDMNESEKDEIEKVPEEENVKPSEPTRIKWGSPTEFMLTCIGYSVGLGNVWRFPYLCYISGGGAFLIPYVFMIILIGMPLLYMEYGFGQYFGIGGLSIYKKVCPMFQGIGIGYTILNGLVCVYYNVIIALSLYYIAASLTSVLPWSHCDNEWNTDMCSELAHHKDNSTSIGNITSEISTYFPSNMSLDSTTSTAEMVYTSPSDEYFRLALMGTGPEHDIGNLGHIRWRLLLALAVAWILVVIFVSKGIQSTGKVAYFTATFPYLMLTVLVARGATLPGAAQGILYFVTPQYEKLLDPAIWFAAATQLFYSTNLAWGGMITMSSYSDFHHNLFKDALVVNIVSFCTSIYAGFAVFSVIGYMAEESNRPIDEIISSGPGLAFIVYPRALSLMPIAQLWSVLFFFMLFLLGVGSQMVQVETILTGIVDKWPWLARRVFTRVLLASAVAVVMFLIAIPMTTQGGMYVLQLMDKYAAGFCVMIIALVECIVVSWIYGSHTDETISRKLAKTDTKFSYHMEEMLEDGLPHIWWRICWKFISPVLILSILIFSLVDYSPAEYGNYRYPLWADGVGWILAMASVVPIFLVATIKIIKADGNSFWEKVYNCSKPTDDPPPGIEQSTLNMLSYSVDLVDDSLENKPYAGDQNGDAGEKMPEEKGLLFEQNHTKTDSFV